MNNCASLPTRTGQSRRSITNSASAARRQHAAARTIRNLMRLPLHFCGELHLPASVRTGNYAEPVGAELRRRQIEVRSIRHVVSLRAERGLESLPDGELF